MTLAADRDLGNPGAEAHLGPGVRGSATLPEVAPTGTVDRLTPARRPSELRREAMYFPCSRIGAMIHTVT